jgi:hypothetical protein
MISGPRPKTLARAPRANDVRTIRIKDPIWDTAMAKADAQGQTLAEVIRSFLIAYAGTDPAYDKAVTRARKGR